MSDPNDVIKQVVNDYKRPANFQPPAEYTQRQIGEGSAFQNISPENRNNSSENKEDSTDSKSWEDIPGVGSAGGGGGSSDTGGGSAETPPEEEQSSGQDPDYKRVRKMIKPVVDGFDFINGLALVFFSGSSPEKMANYRASTAYKKEITDYATETAIEEGWTNIRIHPAILLLAVILAAYGPLYYKAYNDRKANNKKREEEAKKNQQTATKQHVPPQQSSTAQSQAQTQAKEEAQNAETSTKQDETTLVEDPHEPGSMITIEELKSRTKRKPGRQKIPRETRECVQCGTEFEAKVNSNKKFCSRRCSGLHRSAQNNKSDE